ncbi:MULTISPECIES: chemotaxis protein CheW [Fischerella]|uniref:histidine kinase n=1 Tax=Fischerella muscicola CCMEE 5323 TaxID=2019572 RepID=A0A2N6JYF9_FISMU|nr:MULTISPECIES: chemotaxis protein CheW [Fischerella]MBD2430110.1 chemotaxis protein CheW [Fischerella sp. FACHB-380]PLZ85911.1 phosphotransferase [Fischerella muscicola CCMEE 5323]
MLKDRELENQINFLEEANRNLNTLESIFLELKSNHESYLQNIDLALKVIHSIKAGADIIGFPLLSDFTNRLVDALQDFKKQTNFLEVDTELQTLLLSSVEWLRQIVKLLSVGYVVDEQWLASFCFPVFEELKKRLNQQIWTNNSTQYSPPQELEDIILLIFQTEVEEYLQHLKSLLAKTDKSALKAEVIMIATQLGDLGELLHLKAFTQLCQSVMQHLEVAVSNTDVTEIAKLALLTWQRSQTLILTKQLAQLPTEIPANLDKKGKFIREFPEPEVICLELLQDVLFSSCQRENQEITARTPANKIEKINFLFQELTIQQQNLKMHIDRLHKLIHNLSLRVKKLELENYELHLAYDKFATNVSTLTKIHTQNANPYYVVADYHLTDNSQELNYLSQTVIETIAKIQAITKDIENNMADANQVNCLLEKTAQNLRESFVQTPLHLSRQRVMLVECNGMIVALPTNIIVETCLLEQLDSEFLYWQGSTIRLIKLEQYLQSYNLYPAISSLDSLPQIDTANVLIIRDNNQQVAIQIHRCWGEIEVSIHQIEANTTLPTGISNYTIFDDGQIVPVLSAGDLLNWIVTSQFSTAT